MHVIVSVCCVSIVVVRMFLTLLLLVHCKHPNDSADCCIGCMPRCISGIGCPSARVTLCHNAILHSYWLAVIWQHLMKILLQTTAE